MIRVHKLVGPKEIGALGLSTRDDGANLPADLGPWEHLEATYIGAGRSDWIDGPPKLHQDIERLGFYVEIPESKRAGSSNHFW